LPDLHQKTAAYHKAKIKELRSDEAMVKLLAAMKCSHGDSTNLHQEHQKKEQASG